MSYPDNSSCFWVSCTFLITPVLWMSDLINFKKTAGAILTFSILLFLLNLFDRLKRCLVGPTLFTQLYCFSFYPYLHLKAFFTHSFFVTVTVSVTLPVTIFYTWKTTQFAHFLLQFILRFVVCFFCIWCCIIKCLIFYKLSDFQFFYNYCLIQKKQLYGPIQNL